MKKNEPAFQEFNTETKALPNTSLSFLLQKANILNNKWKKNIYNQNLIQHKYIDFSHNMYIKPLKQEISASSTYGQTIYVKMHT
jgi:hypothetical protein